MEAPSKKKSARPLRLGASLLIATVGLWAAPAFAEEVSSLASKLADLRAEVETLSSQLSEEQTQLRNELQSYARQKADLELELQREQTRLKKIRQQIQHKREAIEEQKSADEELEPLFYRSADKVREHIGGTLPFRKDARMAEVEKIESQLDAALLTPERAISRLWAFVEDELRMTSESGLYQQTIRVHGEEQLADVLRVGMVMLFFKTGDGQVGYASNTHDGWTFTTLDGDASRKRVRTLFDSFKKQIRVGYFEVPNALPDAEGER